MSAPELDDIDLAFRPRSYFWPLGLETHLLSRIKGAERKAALKFLIDAGDLEDIPSFLRASKLSEDERKALGSFHPAFMGGEYLPDLLQNEVMVARIVIASTTQDVTCVYARRTKHRIHYRVVDEYEGDTLSHPTTRTSVKPLSLGELESFFNKAWSLIDVLDMNFCDESHPLDAMMDFVVSIESEFYPRIGALYRRKVRAWAAEMHAHSDTDESDRESQP